MVEERCDIDGVYELAGVHGVQAELAKGTPAGAADARAIKATF